MKYSSKIYVVLIISAFQLHLTTAPPPQKKVPETFDFVIVGGGTAGCALARRLSDSGEHSVLVLEAGILPHLDLDVPALVPNFLSNDKYVRTYSIPQEDGRIMEYKVGRTLGGGSSVSAMIFNRGHPNDYNTWAEITGDRSWRYENLLKYFKRTENYDGIYPSNQHGRDGPITVTSSKYVPLLDEWLGAGQFLGYPVADPNGPQTISFCPVEYAKRLGRHVSSYTGYLKPVLGLRPNLKVVLEAEARKIIFRRNQAVGVQFRSNTDGIPSDNVVYARKEVILSAGAIETPALLMKSGIGPKHVLEAARIRPIKYLNVGQNLQDHIATPLDIVINNRSLAFIEENNLNPQTWKDYNETGDGPYASYGGIGGQAFISTTSQGNQTNIPNIQLFHLGSPKIAGLFEEKLEIHKAEWEVNTMIFAELTNPSSRGSVTLNVTHVNSSPLIDFQYFTNPADLEIMIDGNLKHEIFTKIYKFKVGFIFESLIY
ncbi:unnamed protein product [Orchesella dallaii]|uniref:Glucose-methanol-choline oxidoreductase N-terminal domain-containing protein n=1 Tax=Orchesella dallaii TaxID=48710 RepID=A0ABP1PMI4_9HEXA